MALTELGSKVKIKLIERNMSQKELAEKLGVSVQLLNGVIHGGASLRVEELLEEWVKDEKPKPQPQRQHKTLPKKLRIGGKRLR